MRVAVCMAIYGRTDLTSKVLAQIETERHCVDVFLCDNAGDFTQAPSWVRLITPGKNLGWLGGTNLAWREALKASDTYDGFILLNNDVVLSPEFFHNLMATLSPSTAGIVAPLYDDINRFQNRSRYAASSHVPKKVLNSVPYVDGTCMYISNEVTTKIGLLDEEHFGFFGWGADVDYCIRARTAGFDVIVNEAAYLNHIGHATAYTLVSDYKRQALREYRQGMTAKYGRFWGRYLEVGLFRKVLKSLRTFLTSFAPQLTLTKG